MSAQELGWIDLKTRACMRSANLYEAIVCPPGYVTLPKSTVDGLCQQAGLPCREGYECLCRPCQKLTNQEYEVHVGNQTCQKMFSCSQVCGGLLLTTRHHWGEGLGGAPPPPPRP